MRNILLQSKSLITLLDEFRVGQDRLAGLTIYAIPDTHAFYKNQSSTAAVLLEECDSLQKRIWKSRYGIYHNVIEPGVLVLLFKDQRLIGFCSAEIKSIDSNSAFLFFSDLMVDSEGSSVSSGRLALSHTQCAAVKRLQKSPLTLYSIVATGNLSIHSHFLRSPLHRLTDVQSDPVISTLVRDRLAQEFPRNDVHPDGIIRSAWCDQVTTRDYWPETLAKKFGFPTDVRYEKGDVLVCTYAATADSLKKLDAEMMERLL